MIVVMLIATVAFAVIAALVAAGRTTRFDIAILEWFGHGAGRNEPIGPARIQEAARDVTALGSYPIVGFMTLAAVGYLLIVRQRTLALYAALTVPGGMILSTALKAAFDRPRPAVEHATRTFSASFPSGHALLTAVTFLTLAGVAARLAQNRAAGRYMVGLALFGSCTVGLSRVYLGVHYPSDVLAGWCAGVAWATLCSLLADRILAAD